MRNKALKIGTPLFCLFFMGAGLSLFTPTARGEDEVRIPITFPEAKEYKMPQVFFSHDKHIELVEGNCAKCHVDGEDTAGEYMQVQKQPADKQVAYMHATCTQCHREMNAGPRLVECRSCHSASIAAAQK